MRVARAVLIFALLAGPAFGQTQAPVPTYGEPDPDKTPAQIEIEKRSESAYKRSLSNVPNAAPVDPWGGVRNDGVSKPAAKAAGTKRGPPAN